MITEFNEFGFRSAAAFLRARNIPTEVMNAVANHKHWHVQKRVLLHVECPREIRLKFASSDCWYERFVALLSNPASREFYAMAIKDKDKRIRKGAYFKSMRYLMNALMIIERVK